MKGLSPSNFFTLMEKRAMDYEKNYTFNLIVPLSLSKCSIYLDTNLENDLANKRTLYYAKTKVKISDNQGEFQIIFFNNYIGIDVFGQIKAIDEKTTQLSGYMEASKITTSILLIIPTLIVGFCSILSFLASHKPIAAIGGLFLILILGGIYKIQVDILKKELLEVLQRIG